MSDIVNVDGDRDWLVVAWFTEDAVYRPLAESFAAQLRAVGAPHHIYARPALGEWNTTLKPRIVMQAMDAYPGRTIVLADVDIVINGDLAPVTRIDGDVGVVLLAANTRKGGRIRHWLTMQISSRIVVFRQTEGARRFAEAWAAQIKRSEWKHDEWAGAWALLSCLPTTRFSYIDRRFSAREIGQIRDATVAHNSIHDEARRAKRGPLKTMLRRIERRLFRTGHSRARQVQLQNARVTLEAGERSQ